MRLCVKLLPPGRAFLMGDILRELNLKKNKNIRHTVGLMLVFIFDEHPSRHVSLISQKIKTKNRQRIGMALVNKRQLL